MIGHDDLHELRRSLAGAALVPGDSAYDAARRCFNALVDRSPAVIARCAGAGDVGTAFDFARVHGLEVAVRGGGHNPAGHCVCEGGLVVDLSQMRRVEVDLPLVCELEDDRGDEGLGDAADVPRHLQVDRPARRIERRRADDRLGDAAVGVLQRDPPADELTRVVMRLQDVEQHRLARFVPGSGRRWRRRARRDCDRGLDGRVMRRRLGGGSACGADDQQHGGEPNRDIPRSDWSEQMLTAVPPSAAPISISIRERRRCRSNGVPASCCSQT